MRRYSLEEKAEFLKEIEDVGNVSVVCRKHGIAPATAHNWIKKEGLKGGKNYPLENRRLKKKVSELELKNAILKDLLKKTHQVFQTES